MCDSGHCILPTPDDPMNRMVVLHCTSLLVQTKSQVGDDRYIDIAIHSLDELPLQFVFK